MEHATSSFAFAFADLGLIAGTNYGTNYLTKQCHATFMMKSGKEKLNGSTIILVDRLIIDLRSLH